MIRAASAVGDQARALNDEAWVITVIESCFIDHSLRLPNMNMHRTTLFTPSVMMDVIWSHQFMGYKERAA